MSEHEQGYGKIDDPVFEAVLALADRMRADPKYLLTANDIKMIKEGKETAADWAETAYDNAWHQSEQVPANRTKLKKLAKELKVADKPEQNLHTVVAYLETKLEKFVRYNEFAGRPEGCQPLPGETIIRAEWGDDGDRALLDHLQGQGFPRLTLQTSHHAVLRCAEKHKFNPVHDYLEGLRWDGVPRLAQWLETYLMVKPADDAERKFASTAGACWLRSAVARIYRPGCKADHVLVLKGDQGFSKSEALATLCPNEDWFLDDLPPEVWTKAAKERLQGVWIVELAEMPHIKSHIDKVNAFITGKKDTYRRAYGLNVSRYPRYCVYAGTTNSLVFIDPTGSRRFWPFIVTEKIDVAKLARDRDQLWAEAVATYKAGEQWHITDAEVEQTAKHVQAKYTQEEGAAWTELLRQWLETTPENHEFLLREAIQGMGLDAAEMAPRDQQMVTAILRDTLKCGQGRTASYNYWIKPASIGEHDAEYKPPSGTDDAEANRIRAELARIREAKRQSHY